jgi:hypothetical protein
MSDIHQGPTLDSFLEHILCPLVRSDVSSLLTEPELLDDRVAELVKVFDANPEWKAPFLALIKSLHSQESVPALEEQIRFFTLKHSRNWLLVNLSNKVLHIKELQLNMDTGRLPQRPHDLFGYSYQAMSALGDESRYKNVLFACGFIFDFLLFLTKSPILKVDSKYDEAIKMAYTRGIEEAKKCVHIARYKSKLTSEKLVPAIPLLRQAAFITFQILDKNYSELHKRCEQLKAPDSIRCAMERQKYGFHSGNIMTYFARAFPVFETTADALTAWPFVYLNWMSGRRDIHDLAGMGLLGVYLSEAYTSPKDFPPGSPVGSTIPELNFLEYAMTPEVFSGGKT